MGGTAGPPDALDDSRYRQCPGCSKKVLKLWLAHHVLTECAVCMTQKSRESSDDESADQHAATPMATSPHTGNQMGEINVHCNQQGAMSAREGSEIVGAEDGTDTADAASLENDDDGSGITVDAESAISINWRDRQHGDTHTTDGRRRGHLRHRPRRPQQADAAVGIPGHPKPRSPTARTALARDLQAGEPMVSAGHDRHGGHRHVHGPVDGGHHPVTAHQGSRTAANDAASHLRSIDAFV